jgi:predicted amidohydrolase YtcJ
MELMTPLLFTGGPIVTCEPEVPDPQALLIDDGRISGVGSEDELVARAGNARRVDLGGAAMLPGFIDPHHHFGLAAFDRRTPDLHLPPGASVDQVLELVRAHASATPGSGWIRLQGYDPSRLRERRPPRRRELDEACPGRPALVVAYSFHDGVVNSAGLDALGWDRSTPDPRAGTLVRDRRGNLTGGVSEAAFFQAEARSRTELMAEGEDAWISEAAEHGRALLRAGIVRVADPTVDPALERLYLRAVEGRLLPLAVHRMPVGGASVLEARVEGDATGSGPDRSPVGAAKLFLDGADRCAICARAVDLARASLGIFRAARAEGLAVLRVAGRAGGWRRRGDGMLHRGVSFWRTDELADAIERAGAAGLQVAQHALGNEAVVQALDALERSGAALQNLPGRPRLEHTMFLDPPLERRLADSGVACVVQPLFLRDLGDELRLVPLPGGLRPLALRAMRDAGVHLVGSSDYPVADFEPLAAMQAAITRRTVAGATLLEEQALEIDDALALYTRNAARALGIESEAGTLAPGKRADMVVVERDPRETDPERLGDLQVLRTYIDGEIVHRLDPVEESAVRA